MIPSNKKPDATNSRHCQDFLRYFRVGSAFGGLPSSLRGSVYPLGGGFMGAAEGVGGVLLGGPC